MSETFLSHVKKNIAWYWPQFFSICQGNASKGRLPQSFPSLLLLPSSGLLVTRHSPVHSLESEWLARWSKLHAYIASMMPLSWRFHRVFILFPTRHGHRPCKREPHTAWSVFRSLFARPDLHAPSPLISNLKSSFSLDCCIRIANCTTSNVNRTAGRARDERYHLGRWHEPGQGTTRWKVGARIAPESNEKGLVTWYS